MHAHKGTQSSDCDGQIERTMVLFKNDGESDFDFKHRMISYSVSTLGGELRVTEQGFEWHEDTDEGYRHEEVQWCDDECLPESTYRDLRAEQLGY